MPRQLTDADIGGAFRDVTAAIAELAQRTGQVPTRAALSDTDQLEIQRLQLSHPSMLRQDVEIVPEGDFREASAAAEILRLTATHPREFGARPGASRSGGTRPSARARRDADVLSLSRTTASASDSQLVSKWGLPVTVAGVPVTTENSQRLGLGRVLPPLVVDVDEDDFEDISSTVGRYTPGMGDGSDQDPDLGPDVSGYGQQTEEYTNPGVVSDPAAEVSRLIQQHGSAVSSLASGPGKNRHPKTGRFVPKARLTGTLSGV